MQTGNIFDVPRWYAIHTKPKQEDRADSNLSAWRIRTFNPKIRERRHSFTQGHPTYGTKPLFHRYIFAHFKASELLHKICFTRGVLSVVSFGGNPIPIDDEIIEFFQSRIGPGGFIKIGDDLLPGDKVIISGGHLKDLAGIFEGNLKDRDRVAILLTTISYQGRVMIERERVRKVS